MSTVIYTRAGARPTRATPEGPYAWFTLVTPALDAHGTIIRPEGVRTAERFAANPQFLWMHQSDSGMFAPAPKASAVLGRVEKWEQDTERFDILVRFDIDDTEVAPIFGKVQRGFLLATSIGFRPISSHEEEIDGQTVTVYDEVELFEASLVIIGSNPEALKRTHTIEASLEQIQQRLTELNARIPARKEEPVMDDDTPTAVPTVTTAPASVPASEPQPTTTVVAPAPTEPVVAREAPAIGASAKPAMTAEMRANMAWDYRVALGRAADGAMLHMSLADSAMESHRAAHREMAAEDMNRMERMQRLLRDVIIDGEDEDADEMEDMERSAPTNAPADLATRFNKLARAALGRIPRNVTQLVTQELGCAARASDVRVQLAKLLIVAEHMHGVDKQAHEADKQTRVELRNKLLDEAVTARKITPAIAARARGIDAATGKQVSGGWTLADVRKLIADAPAFVIPLPAEQRAPENAQPVIVPTVPPTLDPPVASVDWESEQRRRLAARGLA